MQQLPKFDQELSKKQEEAENAGEVSNSKIVFFQVKLYKRVVAFTASSMRMIQNMIGNVINCFIHIFHHIMKSSKIPFIGYKILC